MAFLCRNDRRCVRRAFSKQPHSSVAFVFAFRDPAIAKASTSVTDETAKTVTFENRARAVATIDTLLGMDATFSVECGCRPDDGSVANVETIGWITGNENCVNRLNDGSTASRQ